MKKGAYSIAAKIRIFIDFNWRERVLPMGPHMPPVGNAGDETGGRDGNWIK